MVAARRLSRTAEHSAPSYLFTRRYAPGERDHGDGWMVAEQRAGFRPPLHHAEEPVGGPRLLVDLSQNDSGHRGHGRGLEHHGVTWTPAQRLTPAGRGNVLNGKLTARQSRSRLANCDLEGVVPGPDSHTHTQGLSAGVCKRSPGELDVLAFRGPNTRLT